MNPLSTASLSAQIPRTGEPVDPVRLFQPFQADLDQVRNLIAERIFREEAFGELLHETGSGGGWDMWDHPEWLVRIVQAGADECPLTAVKRMAEHLAARGGKLYRATLILAILRALKCASPKSITLAAALELIHLATLLHDDVIDEAEMRRGKPSMPTLFDNAPAVLMGDHLYARAFEMLSECGVMPIVAAACRATSAMCRGEVEQLHWIGRCDIPESAYFRLIEMKTAALIACCAHSSALLAGREEDAPLWSDFGNTLGLVFQMADDLLDFTSDPETLGKATGSDAADGKFTLALILHREALGEGGEGLRRFLANCGSPQEIAAALEEAGRLDQVRRRIVDLQGLCHRQLEMLQSRVPASQGFDFLHHLVEFTGARNR